MKYEFEQKEWEKLPLLSLRFKVNYWILKKIGLVFYFLLFTGIILSTSHLGDNYMGISDEEGYLLTIGICCLTAFVLEYLIPKLRS